MVCSSVPEGPYPNISSSQTSIRSAYDTASAAYSRKFIDELDHKPFDRELLERFALSEKSSSLAGMPALYCIVHLTPDQLVPAFSEMFRVLRGGGVLLLVPYF